MLPFLNKKDKEASVVVPSDKIKRDPDEEPASDYDGLQAAVEEFIAAVKSEDVQAASVALRSAFEIMDSEPHQEGEQE